MATKYETNTKLRTKEKNESTLSYFHSKFVFRNEHGFTLIELLIVMAILIVIGGVVVVVGKDLFSLNSFFGDALSLERDAEGVIKELVTEIRIAAPADTGAYTIERAESNSFAFFADIDDDGVHERVQYFKSGSELKKSVVEPVGNPLSYSTTTAQETLKTVLRGVTASTTAPLFVYYDRTFAGTSSPLTVPINVTAVRHLLITLILDTDPQKLPPATVVSTRVSIRNLKDNY